jgi:hypothetical protein
MPFQSCSQRVKVRGLPRLLRLHLIAGRRATLAKPLNPCLGWRAGPARYAHGLARHARPCVWGRTWG